MRSKPAYDAQALQAYAEYEKKITGDHLYVGCWLVITLMPLGILLDYFVYPEKLWFFMGLRAVSVVLAVAVLLFLRYPLSRRYYRSLGLFLAINPVFFICCMIAEAPAEKGGAAGSPYYAGLNLCLLAIGFIMRWSVDLSLMASVAVFVLYLGACFSQGQIPSAQRGLFANNLYFLTLTSFIVIVGSWLHRELRVQEFMSRYALDERTRELELAITRLREAEAQLVQQEKMASLGVLSAGIIHEINNPLNFAATNLFALRKQVATLPPAPQAAIGEILSDIEDGLARVKNIVSDLRLFTHPDSGVLEMVPLQEVVQAALRYLSGEIPESVRVEVQIPPGLMVRANRNKLVHVLINLVENSLDALRLKSFGSETPCIRIAAHAEQERIRLQVWDNGPGIAPEHLPRVFDPFFTTKDVGQGTGLGLSICYRLLQECQGTIQVQSEPGRYCLFTLEFPATPPQPDPEQTAQA